MKGIVDEDLRALVEVAVSRTREGQREKILVWIDTAFNGGLVIPRKQIANLELQQQSSAEAVLANGQLVELETFACYVDWFESCFETQIVANDGQYPLLGTMLLDGHRLDIDYTARTVELS